MHALPTSHPFPVTGIALVAIHDSSRTFRFAVRHQGCQDGGSLGMSIFALTGIIHGETFLHETRIVLPAHETVRVHHGLMEWDIRPHADNAVFLQSTAHPQDSLCTGFSPYDQFCNHGVIKWGDLKTGI